MIVNTSFNVRGEPIVCTPEDAFRCFMGTDIEVLAVGTASSQGGPGRLAQEKLRAGVRDGLSHRSSLRLRRGFHQVLKNAGLLAASLTVAVFVAEWVVAWALQEPAQRRAKGLGIPYGNRDPLEVILENGLPGLHEP